MKIAISQARARKIHLLELQKKGYNSLKIRLFICEEFWHSPEILDNFCEDSRDFPDITTTKCDLFIVLNASPYRLNKVQNRVDLLQKWNKSTQNIIYLNQIGGFDDIIFDGQSLILGGDNVYQMAMFKPQMQDLLLKAGEVLAVKGGLEKRKIATYGLEDLGLENILQNQALLGEIYRTIVYSVREYWVNLGGQTPPAVLGMSGGIDSALGAVIMVDALGKDLVNSVMIYTKYTSQQSLDDAKKCSELLGINHYEIPMNIEEIKHLMFSEKYHKLADLLSNQYVEENLQPRLRSDILMGICNLLGGILVNTSNKSELAVGYTTIYGDLAGGYSPLKDVYKTLVYGLAKWRNSYAHQGESDILLNQKSSLIPPSIIEREPTAELKNGQKDSDNLPPYEDLDRFLFDLLELKISKNELLTRYGNSLYERVIKMLKSSEFKRKQASTGGNIMANPLGVRTWQQTVSKGKRG